MAKTLHFLIEEGALSLSGKTILELGSGTGLLGIYLGCLGVNVVMADLSSVKDLTERNISLNKSMIKGKVEFAVANWY